MEMGKFVPQILRHFDIEWAGENADWETHCNFFHKQTNMPVRFKGRTGREVSGKLPSTEVFLS